MSAWMTFNNFVSSILELLHWSSKIGQYGLLSIRIKFSGIVIGVFSSPCYILWIQRSDIPMNCTSDFILVRVLLGSLGQSCVSALAPQGSVCLCQFRVQCFLKIFIKLNLWAASAGDY